MSTSNKKETAIEITPTLATNTNNNTATTVNTNTNSTNTKEEVDKQPLVGDAAVRKFLSTFQDSYIPAVNLDNHLKIGSGSYAVVWKCNLKNNNNELVAVKQMHHHLFTKETDVKDFFREARILEKVNHENVIKFRGVSYADFMEEGKKSLCVVQEYMNMGTLKKMIQKKLKDDSAFSAHEALGWMIQVAKGIIHLHNPKTTIIHRDLKPSNILLHKNEESGKIEVKLADFGLSVLVYSRDKMLEKFNLEKKSSFYRNKRFGSVVKSLSGLKDFFDSFKRSTKDEDTDTDLEPEIVEKRPTIESFHSLTEKTGSFAYMAPEVYKSLLYNEKVDVFSFGIIMYEVINGNHPFIKFAKAPGNPKDVRLYAEQVSNGYRPGFPKYWPVDMKILIAECLHNSPDDRPTMRVVLQRLEAMYELGIMQNVIKKQKKRNIPQIDETKKDEHRICTCCTTQ